MKKSSFFAAAVFVSFLGCLSPTQANADSGKFNACVEPVSDQELQDRQKALEVAAKQLFAAQKDLASTKTLSSFHRSSEKFDHAIDVMQQALDALFEILGWQQQRQEIKSVCDKSVLDCPCLTYIP